MSEATPLDQLADAYQIEPAYHDIWQRRHETSAETKRALLAAMGAPVESDRAIAASLDAITTAAAGQWVPGLLIRRQDTPLTLPVLTGRQQGRLAWTFCTEEGAIHQGAIRLDDLAIDGPVATGNPSGQRRLFDLPLRPTPGYHRLYLTLDDDLETQTEIIVTPTRGFCPPELGGDSAGLVLSLIHI